MKNHIRRGTIIITMLYGIAFTLWIFFRNRLFLLFGGAQIVYSTNQTIIDLGFGLATATSIYFLIQYYKIQIIEETNIFKNIIDNTTSVIFSKKTDRKYLFVNKQYERLFHTTNEKIKGITDNELWPKEFAENIIANDKEVLETGKTITFEEIAPQDDGLHTYISVKFPIRDLSGKVYAMGGVSTDITDRKKIEKELKHSLALSNATLESTADGILVVSDDAKKIKGFNQNFVKMWNIPTDLLKSRVDKHVLDHVTHLLKDPDAFLSKVLELYDQPEKESFDILELADGRTFERYSKPQISDEEIIGRVWSFRDITERKKTEKAEKERVTQMTRFQETVLALTQIEITSSLEEKLDKIIEMTSNAVKVERVSVWFYDEAQSLIRSHRIFQLSDQSFIPGSSIDKKDFPEYFKAIEKAPLIDAHDAIHDPRTSGFFEYYLKPLGITSMLDTPIRIEGKMIGIVCLEHVGPQRTWSNEEQVFSSSVAGIIAVSVEHEHRRNAERKIKISEKKYRFLAETVPQLLWTANPDGAIDFYNNNMLKYTGKSFEDLSHWGWEDSIHPKDLTTLVSLWKNSIKTGEPLSIEFRLLGADNSYEWFLGSATPQKNKNGDVVKWFGSITNINEQKESTELMKLKNEELIRINSDLDNFIYTASHDLKAPIANIEGLLNTLIDSLDEKSLEEEPSEIIKMMTESIDKFKHVILDLTEVSKAQKSGDINHIENCSFIEVVEEIEDSIAPLIKTNKATIQTDFSKVTNIKYSKKNLRSILYNLISNAIKYRSKEKNPVVNIKTEIVDNWILLSVKDNGLGMRPEIVSQIFKMFKRFHTHVEGSGIGLYVVKKIIENTGGNIEVESEEGKGSAFKIYLKQQ